MSLRKRLWNPEARLAYLLIAPTAVFLVFFMFYPIISGVPTSNSTINALKWFGSWVF